MGFSCLSEVDYPRANMYRLTSASEHNGTVDLLQSVMFIRVILRQAL